ncbi:tetratricopeptide repeat protein 17-like isoform X2 [Mizuhopecten yessoensis]|uniref:Tetratricopeptide repeat protein 17 n=1 Tax=Mizuhopecten yessoensis TaxID=6573 RepID=A0A210PFX7_MIZYE|nr:tetratricopeptide repeat protein 17-like isoform X2 [Mizuhopecten yessoensis]OWF35392.1 Tetratricopeptide repeat protein 17 [Mizuhopecten yessoensis]
MAATVLVVVLLVAHHFPIAGGSSHWVVTEEGLVRAQADTVFNLRRPYDLVAFMKQDDRTEMLEGLKEELLTRKDEIDKNEDRDTGLEQRFYKTDADCLKAGKPLPEFDLYISTVLPLENKGIRPEEHIDVNQPLHSIHSPPDCTLFSELDYSIHAFEHLEGMKVRDLLSGTPELGLKNAITYQDDVDQYGSRVYHALLKNDTSWVLYNMAAFYWRIKGDPYQVIECVRRALHYSPRQQKDVALISLANVLHRARYSNEAAIVVHAALDISKERNVNHFTLGNIYAVLAEYNKSVICFENTLKIQPDFEAAAKRKHAVHCHAKLENALEAQHRSLQRTLNDLKDYQKKHDFWQNQNEKLISEQVSNDVKLLQHKAFENFKIQDSTIDIGEYCRMVDREGKQVLMCTWGKKASIVEYYEIQEEIVDATSPKDSRQPTNTRDERPQTTDYSKPVRDPLFTKDGRSKEATVKMPLLDDDWPGKEECDTHVQKVPDPHNLSMIYLSPENKGFEIKALLTEAQNLTPGDEHPLPWYPPVCVPLEEIPEGSAKSYDHIKSVSREERTRMPLKMSDKSIRQTLLNHVNGGVVTEEEVGQRILTALKKSVGPKWMLYNLAGMYWRIIGNNYHGIECIRRSLVHVPDKYKDVPLVNLANILYRWGRYHDAVKVMRDALNISDIEPSSHFFFGNVLWAAKNYTGAVKHYQISLEIQPDNPEVVSTLRAIKCFQRYHQATQSAAPQETAPPVPTANCQPRLAPLGKGKETESRVICKRENGEEKCVIETRSRSKSGECNGHCTQTCTVTPIKLDSCAGDIHPGGELPALSGDGAQCPSAKNQASNGGPEEPTFGSDFSTKLDEVSEYYLTKGVCQGEECSQLRVQQGGQKPHIKLDFVNGVLHQKLIFVSSPNELHVEADECVIFNDGSKSSGCNQPEYRAYLEEFDYSKEDFDQIQMVFIEHRSNADPPCGTAQKPAPQDSQSPDGQSQSQPIVSSEKHPPHLEPEGPPAQEIAGGNSRYGSPRIPQMNDGRPAIDDDWFPDSELPDTSVHVTLRYTLPPPIKNDCKEVKDINFKEFTSTWLSVSAKGIDLRKHIDFDTVIKRDFEEPYCMTDVTSPLDLDSLPGITHSETLNYFAETGLKEVLQKLGGDSQPVGVVGTRIAHALKKNTTSWVLTNVAALYWRVEGDAKRAIQCLRLSLTTAPTDVKDTSLVSIANVLHRAGYINDAIVATDLALHISKRLVVSHFTMANLYAAKEQWDQAKMFYESTLGLQTSFEPAKQRLKAIMCKMLKT